MKRSVAETHPVPADQNGGPRTIAESIYRRLRQDVLWGRFAPGAPLRSDELRAHYNVGISPLREALTRLASERLVTSVGQRGFRVAPLTAYDVEDTMRTRIVLERDALARSIENGDIAWETAVVAAFHTLSRNPIPRETGSATEGWAVHHRQFHLALIFSLRLPLADGACRASVRSGRTAPHAAGEIRAAKKAQARHRPRTQANI